MSVQQQELLLSDGLLNGTKLILSIGILVRIFLKECLNTKLLPCQKDIPKMKKSEYKCLNTDGCYMKMLNSNGFGCGMCMFNKEQHL